MREWNGANVGIRNEWLDSNQRPPSCLGALTTELHRKCGCEVSDLYGDRSTLSNNHDVTRETELRAEPERACSTN